MDELGKVTHDPKVIKALEAKGITSLEQIALSSPALLGLLPSKAEHVIGCAMQNLAEENIEHIIVSKMDIRLTARKINRAIFDSICYALGATPNENCLMKRETNTITFSMKEGKRSSFKEIARNAGRLLEFLKFREEQTLISEGITLPHVEIIQFAKKKGYQGFCDEFFTDIVGNELMKKALTISLFSTFEDPVHSLVLGDPGSAKTLARDLMIANLSNITSVGANATKSGLVCNLSTGELGALGVSDKKVVMIDEFDKINPADFEFCYELMSNGRCSVHSARVHKDIVSHFILVAFGNPKSSVFNNAMPIEDIGLEKTLLSRFAFIVKTDTLSRKEKEHLFKNRFLGESKTSEHSQLFDQWIKLARTRNPVIKASNERIEFLVRETVKIVEIHATTQLRRDLRMGDYLRRIALAFARMEFTDVTDEIIDKAFELIKESIDVWNFKGGNIDFF